MNKRKVIDIFPPKKFESRYQPPIQEKKKIEKEKLKFHFPKGRLILVLSFLILIGFICYFTLSKAEIEIWPETKIISFTEKIVVDSQNKTTEPAFWIKNSSIPGLLFEEEKEGSQEFSATGKILKEEKAQGTIRVYNNYHLSQALVATTRFQPPLEKVFYFRTTKRIYIPAKSYVDVEVIADRPGQDYNIGPSTFSVPGLAGLPQYYSVYGKSFSPMTGGFVGEVAQVTQEDLDKAKNTLSQSLFEEIKKSLNEKLSQNSFILLNEAQSQEIIEFRPSVEEEAEAEKFQTKVKVKFKALLFRETDLEKFAKEFILAQISEDEKIQADSLKIKYKAESIDLESGQIILNLEFSAKVYYDVDAINLKKVLRGKSLTETKFLLEDQPHITKVQVKFWPFWVNKVPKDIDKVEIKLNI